MCILHIYFYLGGRITFEFSFLFNGSHQRKIDCKFAAGSLGLYLELRLKNLQVCEVRAMQVGLGNK